KSDNSLSYSDNSLPEFETFSDHTEETRSGSTTAHANNSLLEYDSFCFKIAPDQGSTTAHANNSLLEYDSLCFKIAPDQGRLASVVMNNIYDNLTNDPLLEAVDLFLVSDNSIPPEFLSNDSLSLPENESSSFDHHDDPSFPRPPPEPPDVEIFFEPDSNQRENEDKVFKLGILSYLLVSHQDKTTSDFSENPMMMYGSNDSLSLPENESSSFDHHDDPSFPRPPPEPPDVEIFFEPDSNQRENEDKVFKPGILSYLLVSHRDKTTFDFSENPMMMYGRDIPLLVVLDLHTIPMDK
nr:hypothetical protein [Tanacetum cinerariifolium]